MPPKNKFSKEQIIEAAFDIARLEGIDSITIRGVAEKLGSSIAPIYVNFNDVDELKQAVVSKVYSIGRDMALNQDTGNPFRDIGAASLQFATEYSVIFKELLLKGNSYLKNYDDEMGAVLIDHMKKDPDLAGFSEEQLKTILLKMRIFQLGLSVMVANGMLPETAVEDKAMELLESVSEDVVFSTAHRKVKQPK
jgi:AcrR family transcriptional regulator